MRFKMGNKLTAMMLAVMLAAGTAWVSPAFATGLEIEPLKGVQGSEDSAESWRYDDGAIIDEDQDVNAQMGSSVDGDVSVSAKPGDPDYGTNNNKSWSFAGIKCSGGYLKGIDVSYWQYNINWAKVKKVVDSGKLDFVIIRCGYGKNRDSKFERNADACEKYDIPYGVYLYSYATSDSYAKAEANNAISIIKGHDLSYPVYYDLEDNSVRKKGRSKITNYAKIFCSKVTSAGYRAGVYANLSWFNSYIDGSKLRNQGYDLWLAQWPSSDKNYNNYGYGNRYSIWQCGSRGSVSGISGRVDTNLQVVSHKTMSEFMQGVVVPDSLEIETPDISEGYIGEESVVARTGPGKVYKPSATYLFGERVDIIGMVGNYYQVYSDTAEYGNWIRKDSLASEEDPWEKVTEEEPNENGETVYKTYIKTFGGDIITSSWVTLCGATYYVDETGAALTGIQELDGYTYGFNDGGAMFKGTTVIIGDGSYTFDSQGRAYLFKAKTTHKIKYRKGPGKKYAIKGTFKKGTTVRIIKQSGSWSQMKNGYWVKTRYLKTTVTYPMIVEEGDLT